MENYSRTRINARNKTAIFFKIFMFVLDSHWNSQWGNCDIEMKSFD